MIKYGVYEKDADSSDQMIFFNVKISIFKLILKFTNKKFLKYKYYIL